MELKINKVDFQKAGQATATATEKNESHSADRVCKAAESQLFLARPICSVSRQARCLYRLARNPTDNLPPTQAPVDGPIRSGAATATIAATPRLWPKATHRLKASTSIFAGQQWTLLASNDLWFQDYKKLLKRIKEDKSYPRLRHKSLEG